MKWSEFSTYSQEIAVELWMKCEKMRASAKNIRQCDTDVRREIERVMTSAPSCGLFCVCITSHCTVLERRDT